jgi:polar amino acid transport system substrate-binding protein
MNKLSKKLILAVITIGAIGCSASSWAQPSLNVAGQGIAPWAIPANSPNTFSGISVDLINSIAKDAGLQAHYQVMVFADLIPALNSGKIDVIATNMAITPERKQQVDFSIPIYKSQTEVIVVLASDTTAYRTLADFKGLPVGAQKGSIQLALLQRTGGFSEIKVYDTGEDAWAAVASGAIRAAITPGGNTVYAAKQGQLQNLRIVSSYQSPSPRPQIGIAVKKGNSELLAKINNSLATLETDGTVKAIFSKYGYDDWVNPNSSNPTRASGTPK